MRWFFINCLLLATALATPEVRQKRDLTLLKTFLTSTFGGNMHEPLRPFSDPDTKHSLFRIPSLGNKLVIRRERTKAENTNGQGIVIMNEKRGDVHSSRIGTGPEITGRTETLFVTPNQNPTYDTEYKVKIPFEPKYSYKQMQNNVPVMTYTAHTNFEALRPISEEIRVRAALPMCIKERIGQVVLMGANPYTVSPVSTIFPMQPTRRVDITYPGGKKLPVLAQSYHEQITPGKIPALPIPFTNHFTTEVKQPQFHPVINMDQINGDNTVGLVPPPYIPHLAAKNTQEKKQESAVKVDDGSLATPIPNQSTFSYVYRQHYSNNPNSATVVKVEDQNETHFKNGTPKKYPSNDVFIPPHVNVSHESISTEPENGSKIDKLKASDYISNWNEKDSFKNNPVVVSDDNTFSYHQHNIDGSSMNINGNHKGVSVDVRNSTVTDNRGDIPDSLM